MHDVRLGPKVVSDVSTIATQLATTWEKLGPIIDMINVGHTSTTIHSTSI